MPSSLRHGAHLTGVLLVVTACTVTMSATPAEARKTYTRSAYAFARATARITEAATVTVTQSGRAGSITRTSTVRVTARATVSATAGAGATAHGRASTRTKAHTLAHKRARHIARSRAATKARAAARRRAISTAHAAALKRATADAKSKAVAAARAAPKPPVTAPPVTTPPVTTPPVTTPPVTTPPVTTPPVTTPPTDGRCGKEMPADADAICTLDDEFDGTTLDTTKWSAVTTASSSFHGGPECYVDSPNNISVSGGTLKLTARKEAAPIDCYDKLHGDPTTHVRSTQYTAGSVSSIGKFSQTFGQFSIRAKFPATKVAGLQSSLWMWPADQAKYGVAWPASGEIDIAEEYSANSTLAIPYLHYLPDPESTRLSSHTNEPTNYCAITLDAFHEYTLAWTDSRLTISIDGAACLIDNYQSSLGGSAPFDQPFFMILTQGLGVSGNTFDPDSTPLPATTEIDYVHVWSQP